MHSLSSPLYGGTSAQIKPLSRRTGFSGWQLRGGKLEPGRRPAPPRGWSCVAPARVRLGPEVDPENPRSALGLHSRVYGLCGIKFSRRQRGEGGDCGSWSLKL